MTRYLTPGQFRSFDVGLPGIGIPANTGVQDTTIARMIARAESDIDAEMGFPLHLGGGGFEPHTVQVYQPPFDMRTRKIRVPLFPLTVRNVLRYRIQISNVSSSSSAGLYADVSKFDAIVNDTLGYIEIVPLQLTYSGLAAIWSLGLDPPIDNVDLDMGFYLQALGDTLFLDTTDSSNKTYRALRTFWASTYNLAIHLQPLTLPPVPPNVYVGGTLQAANTYTVNYSEGQVVFNSAPGTAAVVTADYTYTIPDQVRDACLDQAVWLLGQRQLNLMGVLPGLDLVRSGGREARRSKANVDEGGLVASAIDKLRGYKMLASA